MIQSLGEDNVPESYDIVIKAERCLIQVGRLSPRLSMSLILDVLAQQPNLVPIPVTSTCQFLTPAAPLPSTKILKSQGNRPYQQQSQRY